MSVLVWTYNLVGILHSCPPPTPPAAPPPGLLLPCLTHPLKSCLHGELGGVSRVHPAAEGLDEALKHLVTKVAADELLNTLLLV